MRFLFAAIIFLRIKVVYELLVHTKLQMNEKHTVASGYLPFLKRYHL